MIPLRDVDPARIAAAWNGSVPARYRIDGQLIAQNLLESDLLHVEASGWDDEGGFVAIKRSAAGLYRGPDPKVAHLSLFGGSPERSFRHALDVLRSEGTEALVIGTDNGHFLPGAPTDIPVLGGWLRSQGFEAGGLVYDLEQDLALLPRSVSVSPHGRVRVVRNEDLPALDDFLSREFPDRWHFDTTRKIEAEGPETVCGLFTDDGCEGFAIIQNDGCKLPVGGAVWQSDLGPNWGALGPIGISASLRGQGLGLLLLRSSLQELKQRGSRRTIIDWTGLVDFYGSVGFSVTRTYRSYRLDLLADRSPSA